jgi:magnesium chelatase subunit H
MLNSESRVAAFWQAARRVARQCPGIDVRIFSDRDISARRQELEAALKGADVFFGSLLFDYDQVEWLREHIKNVPIRLVFESALELMGTTQLGGFKVCFKCGCLLAALES